MLMMIKGEEHIPKETDTPEAFEEQAEMPKEKNPETSMASPANILPLSKEIDMQDNLEIFMSLAEDMAKCLLDDTEMRFLLSAAMGKIANVRLKRNLAILLEDFALRLTAVSNLESVAHFVSLTPNDRTYY